METLGSFSLKLAVPTLKPKMIFHHEEHEAHEEQERKENESEEPNAITVKFARAARVRLSGLFLRGLRVLRGEFFFTSGLTALIVAWLRIAAPAQETTLCGTLVFKGDEPCLQLQVSAGRPFAGETFLLDDYGGYQEGARVCVTGTVTVGCASFCAAYGCIAVETIGLEPVPRYCAGDCDGNRTVTVAELMNGVALVLEHPVDDACRPAFCSADCGPGPTLQPPTVSCLVRAVGNALHGCPEEPCQIDADCDDRNFCSLDRCTANGCSNVCACD